VLAMLAAKPRLRVAPRGCALPLTDAARGALRSCRPGRRNGVSAEQRNVMVGALVAGWGCDGRCLLAGDGPGLFLARVRLLDSRAGRAMILAGGSLA
jgi:hypothetical protein